MGRTVVDMTSRVRTSDLEVRCDSVCPAPLLPDEVGELYRLLIADVREYAIFVLDPGGLVISWNAGAESIKGYRADEILGRHFSVFYPADDVAAGTPEQNLAEAARDGRVEYEGWRVRKDGSRFWADVVITAMIGDDGVLRGFGKVTRDLTERHATEQEHHHRSLHDALTGLPNRALLGDRLDQALGRLERHAGSVAVLFIDLNDFKGINDTYGHDSGDAVLVDVAQRLLTAFRPEDTVARIGGDEFVAVCGDVTGPPAGRAIADRVIAAFGSPMSSAAGELAVSASIGIALTARPDISAPVMLRRADKAMYEAKRLGRATSHAHLVSDDEGA